MLQIKNIRKQYVTGDLVQTALDDVSLNFRDNEFVAILGPSGSGKTTMLNIIGGLDRYDSGDLIINGISTKQYKDRDWDSYRNHTIGFVFQSYNLIPHQTVLANVELALTISGISKSERRRRAKEALEKVGLGNQIHKKPNQMSGGQMQRVAIARALVNNPAILLADEPTGALDSETSVQVMEMLKEVAKDRLVIMVTHNPELAYEYATRIVKVKDGRIQEDSMPFDSEKEQPAHHENMGKSSMSVLTALGLSFNNLKTKKGRTLLTSFAGSIGIIGIALILSLSNGVNTYIQDLQKDTMTAYPISIEAQSFDFTTLMLSGQNKTKEKMLGDADHKLDGVYSDGSNLEMASTFKTSLKENNLTDFKKYLDDPDSEINKYIGENGIVYNYATQFSVFTHDADNELVNTDGSTFSENNNYMVNMMLTTSFASTMPSYSTNNFEQLMPGAEGTLVSPTITENYELLYGSMPNAYNEVVLVLDKQNEIPMTSLYQLGFLPSKEYKDLLSRVKDGEEVSLDAQKISYTEICSQKFYLVPECDFYEKDKDGLYKKISASDIEKIETLLDNALELKITGIIRPNADNDNQLINSAVGYTHALTEYLIDYTNKSDVVRAQEKQKEVNILTGMHFDADNDKQQKIQDITNYINDLGISEKALMYQTTMMIEQMKKANLFGNEEEPTEKETVRNVSYQSPRDAQVFGLAFHPDNVSVRPLSELSFPEEEIFTEPEESLTETETEILSETESVPESEPETESVPDSTEELTESETESESVSETESETESESESITETETETEVVPPDLTPEMLMQYLEQLKENIANAIGTGKENIDAAIENEKEAAAQRKQRFDNAVQAGDELLQDFYHTLKAIASLGKLIPDTSNMTQEDLLRMYLEQMGGGAASGGMNMQDLMSMYTSASGMQDLLNQGGGQNLQDLMSMYTAASGMQDLLSLSSNPAAMTGTGTSAQDLMKMYTAASGVSQDDLMKMYLQGNNASDTSGTSTEDLMKAYASASGMSTEDLMKMYTAQNPAPSDNSGNTSGKVMTPEEMMKAYLDGSMSQEELMNIYAQQQGMSQQDMQEMMGLAELSETELAQKMDEYMNSPDENTLLELYDRYIASGSYDDNMNTFGVVSMDAPSAIELYVDSFEAKESIQKCIDNYNADVAEEDQIRYTDYVGLLMSSVTTIVNVISYILIAFVAVSLVVSSIMIGIITYISVLERTKEIGILRAIGASKQNISQVFNAETFIIGLCSGLIGVGMTELILIPSNFVIHTLADSDEISAILPFAAAIILVIISIVLTLIGGLIPAKKAAAKDPVTALRTE